MLDRRRILIASAGAALAGGLDLRAESRSVAAGVLGDRPVSLVLPYAAGGGLDAAVRAIAAAWEAPLGRKVLIEHRPGAGGLIGAELVARAVADGHTLVLGGLNHLVQARLQPHVRLRPLTDFAPVGLTGTSGGVLVVSAQGPILTLADLLTEIRRRSPEPAYGSGGIGTLSHVAGAALLQHTGLKARHVPYRGSVDLAGALLNEDILFAIPIQATVQRLVEQGRLRALAVTAAQRSAALPAVPTLAERLASPDVVVEGWSGVWAPAGTPEPVVQHLHASLARAMKDPSVAEVLRISGITPLASPTPDAFAEHMRREAANVERLAVLLLQAD